MSSRCICNLVPLALVAAQLWCSGAEVAPPGPAPPGPEDPRQVSIRAQESTTKAYKEAAEAVLLEEVNRIAGKLDLADALPINRNNAVAISINPPFWSDQQGWFGTVSTPSYHYFASVANRISKIEWNRTPFQPYLDSIRRLHSASKSTLDTNAVHTLATNWLAAAGVDVASLESECNLVFHFQDLGEKFVPVFWVVWRQPWAAFEPTAGDTPEYRAAASVWLSLPDRKLLQLSIVNPRYFLNNPLTVPNRGELLQQTADTAMRQYWFTTQDYDKSALQALIHEANWARRQLTLPGENNIEASNLTKAVVATPFVAEQGYFGAIQTAKYTYAVLYGGKVCCVRTNLPPFEEGIYLASVRKKYETFHAMVNTNRAVQLSRDWLRKLSVDVSAMERQYKPVVYPWRTEGHLIPFCEVDWEFKEDPSQEIAARVQLLEPDSALKSLVIQKTAYMTREPIMIHRSGNTLVANPPP